MRGGQSLDPVHLCLTWIKDRTVETHMTREQRGFHVLRSKLVRLDSGLEAVGLNVVGVVCVLVGPADGWLLASTMLGSLI